MPAHVLEFIRTAIVSARYDSHRRLRALCGRVGSLARLARSISRERSSGVARHTRWASCSNACSSACGERSRTAKHRAALAQETAAERACHGARAIRTTRLAHDTSPAELVRARARPQI